MKLIFHFDRPEMLLSTKEVRLSTDSTVVITGQWPPWPVAADILSDREAQIFMGLSYVIHDDIAEYVHQLVKKHNNPSLRILSPSNPIYSSVYGDDTTEYLDLVWARDEPERLIPAQLAEADWCYMKGKPEPEMIVSDWHSFNESHGFDLNGVVPVAVEITDFEETLTSQRLRMPDYFRVQYRTA